MTVGFALGKLRILDSTGVRVISSLIVKATLPALIIHSLQRPFAPELLGEAMLAFAIAFIYYILANGLGILAVKALGTPQRQRGTLAFSLGFSNSAFIGFPVVSSILGQDALFITSIQNLPFNLLAFSAGILVISGSFGKKGAEKMPLSRVINQNVIAAVLGFTLFLCSIKLPEAISLPLGMLGGLTTPLAMLVTGSMLARTAVRSVLGDWRIYAVSVLRLALWPLLTALVLTFFGIRGEMFAITVIIAGMPAASNTGLLAEVYGGDTDTASAIVFMTTLLSVLTIPVLALLIK